MFISNAEKRAINRNFIHISKFFQQVILLNENLMAADKSYKDSIEILLNICKAQQDVIESLTERVEALESGNTADRVLP